MTYIGGNNPEKFSEQIKPYLKNVTLTIVETYPGAQTEY